MIDHAADLDRRIGALESAWSAGGPPDLHQFLPPPTDARHLPVLSELVRVDLEYRQRRGLSARIEGYRERFPSLFSSASLVRDLAFEEYRLRAKAGEPVHPREYASRFGIDTSDWPVYPPRSEVPTRVVAVDGVEAAPPFPQPGETVGDYRLVAELGRGSFGRVYLAEEAGLAGRRVAVKLSTRFGLAEPHTLARLQHTHIVPVYSTHRVGAFQLVVMPFLGVTTLADLLSDLRGRGVWPASGRELADTLAGRRSATLPLSGKPSNPAEQPIARPVAGTEMVRRTLARFTFPDAVLWIGARLADALAHAHERGILHRDVKPANVLLTDDGQPMLLDFNLAADVAQGTARIGGTPAYMAPEQLECARGMPVTIDDRTDVFSLGVVLFELLTGRHPFPLRKDSVADPIAELLRLRSEPVPRLRSLNPTVSPSTEAIVLRCLAPNPADRYPSARALAEDLDRQVANQPLAHAREPSVRERFRKWRRRHPRLASSGTVAGIAAVLVLALAGSVIARQERVKRLEGEQAAVAARDAAADEFRAFRAEAREVVPLLSIYARDAGKRAEGEGRARALLARYEVTTSADWFAHPRVRLLPEGSQRELRERTVELLLVLARTQGIPAPGAGQGGRERALGEALRFLDVAAAIYESNPVPRAILSDRADVLGRLGRRAEADQLRDWALRGAPISPRDYYLCGTAFLARGEHGEAVKYLEEATRGDPKQFAAWLSLGVAYFGLERNPQAEGCFHACIAIDPEHPMAYFNRGLTRLKQNQFERAEADFTATVRLKPEMSDAYINRALARQALTRPAEVAADVTKAMELGANQSRLYFLRSRARLAAKDAEGAAADRAAGLAATPTDEADWIERGMVRSETDPAAAIADFDAALKLNPRSFAALQDKASILSERLNRLDEAIATLDRALEFYPDALATRAGRAVLLARKGNRAAAHADADRCMSQGPAADILYQLAGVYALTSQRHPEDARIAYHLLADALGQGYGFDFLASDPDLAAVRGTEEFKRVVEAARLKRARPK